VRAQEPGRNYRIGFLTGNPREAAPHIAFFDELRMSGFIDGQNLAVIAGGFGVRNEQVSAAAAAIVQSAPDAIVSAGPVATRAAQAATKTIPILATSDDMVGGGLVPSLRRPGGNTTGVSLLAPELDGKRQDILIEAVPGIRRIAALADPNVSTPQHLEALKDAARARGVELSVFSARTPEAIAPAMNEANASGAQAINVLATPLFFFNRHTVIVGAAAMRLPAMVISCRDGTNSRCPLYPPKADTNCGSRNVRFVPQADSCTAAKSRYSITSSAVASSDVGIVRPSIFAVLRLTASSNLVGCSTGISVAFTPRSSFTSCREMMSP
jgi:hypothetical protein